jgi:hypothetical protein
LASTTKKLRPQATERTPRFYFRSHSRLRCLRLRPLRPRCRLGGDCANVFGLPRADDRRVASADAATELSLAPRQLVGCDLWMESRCLVPAAADFQSRENAAHQDHCNDKAEQSPAHPPHPIPRGAHLAPSQNENDTVQPLLEIGGVALIKNRLRWTDT